MATVTSGARTSTSRSSEELVEEKLDLFLRVTSPSQRGEALVRRRDLPAGSCGSAGIECRSPSGYAEAFYAPKVVLSP